VLLTLGAGDIGSLPHLLEQQAGEANS